MKRLISRLTRCDGLALVAKFGTGVQHGKVRIYAHFKTGNPSKVDKASFVKKEYSYYGMAHHIPDGARNYLHHLDTYSSKGVKYSYCDEKGENHDGCTSTWKELSDKIEELIEKGKYLNEDDMDVYLSRYGGGGQVNEVQKNN